MANYNISLSNLSCHWERYGKARDALWDIQVDKGLSMCSEDENLEALRKQAEIALDDYATALGRKCIKEHEELNKKLMRADSVNLLNLFKRRP